jgi:hypothetical protein
MNEQFVAACPATPNRDRTAEFGVAVVTIQWWARLKGLKKAPAYRSQVQRQNATGRGLSAGSGYSGRIE